MGFNSFIIHNWYSAIAYSEEPESAWWPTALTQILLLWGPQWISRLRSVARSAKADSALRPMALNELKSRIYRRIGSRIRTGFRL
jgi:hypothetical protein